LLDATIWRVNDRPPVTGEIRVANSRRRGPPPWAAAAGVDDEQRDHDRDRD
jgi:hypothetical protein